jgi:YVTN family beta-propeller protein
LIVIGQKQRKAYPREKSELAVHHGVPIARRQPVRERSGQPPIGARPNCISFTPDSDRLFVSNTALDSVFVIDAATMKQLAVMPVGRAPKRSNTLVLR